MALRTETIAYEADGLRMTGHYCIDDANQGSRPGVLVFPEIFGLGAHAKARAERLAGQGYAALACDLHGEGLVYAGLEEARGAMATLRQEPARLRARALGALQALMMGPEVDAARLAAIGFCFGGTMALELGRSGADVKAIVGFHSGLATAAPQDAANIRGKVLVCLGADDPGVPLEQRLAFEEEMRAAGVDWRMHLYGGVVHSFTNPEADKLGRPELARYDAGADARSWAEMSALFDEVFA